MKARFAIATSVFILLALGSAYGQGSSAVLGRIEIPFKFMANNKEMPAGKYEVAKQPGQAGILLVRSLESKAAVQLTIIERIARREGSAANRSEIVFDTVGDKKYLSEFWPGGTDDGYLLGITKNEQKHQVVKSD
ncbi:MAG: hypothetical protein LAN62_15505 [Acidobacteriia bacterium]|nr:hypothetical protein [Terriglobia bacterium]